VSVLSHIQATKDVHAAWSSSPIDGADNTGSIHALLVPESCGTSMKLSVFLSCDVGNETVGPGVFFGKDPPPVAIIDCRLLLFLSDSGFNERECPVSDLDPVALRSNEVRQVAFRLRQLFKNNRSSVITLNGNLNIKKFGIYKLNFIYHNSAVSKKLNNIIIICFSAFSTPPTTNIIGH